jgi:hypothetical protein
MLCEPPITLSLLLSAYTENGNLVLRTRRQDRWCGNRFFRYTSGWVDTLDKLTIRNGSACQWW